MKFSDLEFRTPSAAAAWFHNLVETAPMGQPFTEPDHSRIMALLQYHPEADLRIGPGVKYFLVQRSARTRKRVLTACRLDGSFALFTVSGCLNGSGSSRISPAPRQPQAEHGPGTIAAAARNAIRPALTTARDLQFKNGATLICPKTGLKISSKNCATVIEPSLESIWADFLVYARLHPDRVDVVFADGKPHLRDASIASEWVDFFHSHCKVYFAHPSAVRKAVPNA